MVFHAHAIDFDDTFHPGKYAHVGSSVVGAAMALLPEFDTTGQELLTAVVAG